MEKGEKTIYYRDLAGDEFSKAKIVPRVIDEKYVYVRKNPFWYISRFFWYRLIAMPIGFFAFRCRFHHKIVGREKLKAAGKSGIFLYANHTQETADAFFPTYAVFPKSVYVVVNPENVSQKFFGRFTPRLGALPLPATAGAARNFVKAVDKRIGEGKCVTIYPEAHIWPYCTFIRPFKKGSFKYPVKLDAPAYSMTNVYSRTKRGKVKITSYIDGPFYGEGNDRMSKEKDLSDKVYSAMCERAKLNTYARINYEPAEAKDD